MKTILALALFALTAAAGLAQDFEGTITWTFRADLDPAMQQQMQAAQSMMANPAIQAQMKAAMEDPQMKAMMEQNPQMKAMIERQMAAASSAAAPGGGLANMLPKGMTLRIKGGNSLSVTEGGMSPAETLVLDGRVYAIDRMNRSYTVVPTPAAGTAAPTNYRVTKTTETGTVGNYRATKYLVEPTGRDAQGMGSMTIWATTEVRGVSGRQISRMNLAGAGSVEFLREIEGVPVKMEINSPAGKMIMEVVTVKAESIPDSTFRLPAGFAERK